MKTVHDNTNANVSIQVPVLDALMNLAGELVLGRNQLLQAMGSDDRRLLETTSQRIDMVTSEIQEKIMRSRMQPLGRLFDEMVPVVDNLARQSGKQVNVSTAGKTVEIDKTIMDAIGHPLTWIVQKAVEEGIESSEIRRKLKKACPGNIELKACQEAGQVTVDISDDGKGIDPDMIVSRAFERGLISEKRSIETITESEKMGLVFHPEIWADPEGTDGLGQFTGIDEVKSCLEKVGGTIDVSAKPGNGTSVRVKLPLTLSIIPSQIITLGDERFAVPQVNLSELLRIPASQVRHTIEKVGDANVIRLRGELLPLVDLAGVLGVDRSFVHPEDGRRYPERRQTVADRRSKNHSAPKTDYDGHDRRLEQDRRYHAESALNIAVVSTGKYKYGLVVDALNDAEEIVVKPLGKHLKGCRGFAGATIMGDGKVALILDVARIGEMSRLTFQRHQDRSGPVSGSVSAQATKSADSQAYLFFSNSETERFAVPLDTVERIEKIEAARIETVGGNRVLKHRGGTLPLIALEDAMRVDPLPVNRHYQMICFKINGREIGVLATAPIDAAEVEITLDTETLKQPGVIGSAVLMNNTTLILDIQQVVKQVKPDFFSEVQGNG